jgi:hypothetical protein
MDKSWFFFLWYWGLNSGPTPWASPPALFMKGFFFFFEIGSHGTICPGWLWNTILLVSASWVARITGVSHWRLTMFLFFLVVLGFELGALYLQSRHSITWPSSLVQKLIWRINMIMIHISGQIVACQSSLTVHHHTETKSPNSWY